MSATCPQVDRQVAHWTAAVDRLEGWEGWASADAWRGLEQYLGLTLRQILSSAIAKLKSQAAQLRTVSRPGENGQGVARARQRLLAFRAEFLRVETMLDFFGDAVNTRTSPKMAALLRACDILAEKSMSQMLLQFNKKVPPVLSYVDKGLGASILKAGLRLWDGTTISPCATIKIVRHNLMRPTSLIHEAGHQVAHQLGWNDELAGKVADALRAAPLEVTETWSGWASEIAADIFAFVHTGYASVAALHDVLAGEDETVFALRPFDPHPISFLRVMLGVELCRKAYGKGPWDALAEAWLEAHPLERAPGESRELIAQSMPLLPAIAATCLNIPLKAFGGKPVIKCVDPQRVSPNQLADLEAKGGAALFSSTQWAHSEALRITALTGYRSAFIPSECTRYWKKQEELMLLLGSMSQQPMNQKEERRIVAYVY